MSAWNDFALFGGSPVFAEPLPVGQLYFPSWNRYEAAMKGIFERRYYTNQGPLVQQLEERLQEYLGVKHAVCVTNATIGLMMAAEALNLSGKVIMPSFTFLASALSVTWADIEPVFCDVDPLTHQLDAGALNTLIDQNVTGIMAVNLWGDACDTAALERFSDQHGIKLYYDSAHAFGCMIGNTKIANFGGLEVFSFHATKTLSATEGGCICTNDDQYAARLRNIRSSYGAGNPVPVVKTSNGRMSEAQAAIALMSLEDFPKNQKNNEILYQEYARHLVNVPGIRLFKPTCVSFSNHQSIVCEVDADAFGLSRDVLLKILKAENVNARRYFFPGTHRTIGYRKNLPENIERLPVTEKLCCTCFQLPIGALVDSDSVRKVCGIIQKIQKHSGPLGAQLKGNEI